jgi:hypothetical protein
VLNHLREIDSIGPGTLKKAACQRIDLGLHAGVFAARD